MKTHFLYIAILIFLASCGGNKSEEMQMDTMDFAAQDMAGAQLERSTMASAPMVTGPENLDTSRPVDKKKIIRDGRMGLKVKDLEKAKSDIDRMVEKYQGYYSNEGFDNNDYAATYNLTIRIPASSFDKLIAAIEEGEGEVTYKNISARDVTEQFIDLETRMENKQAYLKKYNDLLSQARSVKDILEVQNSMRRIEEEIESTVGRLKYLSDQVSYSTLDVMITREKEFEFKPEQRDRFLERLKQSLSGGWHGFISFLLFVIRLWPLWLLAGSVLLIIRRIKKGKTKS